MAYHPLDEHGGNLDSWEIVTTVRDTPRRITEFVAYHLKHGPKRITLYLDDPAQELEDAVLGIDRVVIHRCDSDFWHANNKERPQRVPLRQARNATLTYQNAVADWVCHIDIDEFLAPVSGYASIASQLTNIDRLHTSVRLRPIEYLNNPSGDHSTSYKFAFKKDHSEQEIVRGLYPTYGRYLPSGFVSHQAGKVFVRSNKAGYRIGIHAAKLLGEKVPAIRAEGMLLAHQHCRTEDEFLDKITARLDKKRYEPMSIRKGTVAGALYMAHGRIDNDLVRLLYREMCLVRRDLILALSVTKHLIELDLELDASVQRLLRQKS